MNATLALPRIPAYCASKGGVVMLTKALAMAWAEEGIRVNAVAPGYIETSINAAGRQDQANHPEQTTSSRRRAPYRSIVRMIESGPIPAIHGVVRWRLVDLSQWIYEEFRITVAKQTLSRELRAMGYRKLSARPRHHAQAEGAIEDFKKSSQRAWMKSRAKRQSMLGK